MTACYYKILAWIDQLFDILILIEVTSYATCKKKIKEISCPTLKPHVTCEARGKGLQCDVIRPQECASRA